MKITEKEKEILKENFTIHEDEDVIELESYTEGGVNMIIDVYKEDYDNILHALEDYVSGFEIDEEIDLHRENEDYREQFTIGQSLEDFENYINSVSSIINKLREEQKDA